MTIIAYRDSVLAADTLWVGNDTRDGYGPKIERAGSLLVGCSGSVPVSLRFRAWVAAGFDGVNPLEETPDGNGIVVWQGGVVGWCSRGSWPVSEGFYAIGSGCEFATGAMEMGATAEEAVQVAIKHSTSCGGPINVLRL